MFDYLKNSESRGVWNSDGRELPKWKHTTFRTRQKFEIKNNSPLWEGNCKTHSTIQKTPNQDTYKIQMLGNYPEESI